MIAPPYVSRIVPMVGADHPQLWSVEEHMYVWAPEDVELRFAASSFLEGGPGRSAEALAALLRRHPEIVAIAAAPAVAVDPELPGVLRRAGFPTAGIPGPDVVLFSRRP